MIPLDQIREAATRVRGEVHRTPILTARSLGDPFQVHLALKCENFQKTGSFKVRGALNKVRSLSEAERARGLITVSAGNHAQAVAWAARRVGAPCAVVMPEGAPRSKMDAVRGYGAEIILHPDRATLFDRLNEERERRGSTFVHPFDDPVVLAGAGTVGLEIAEDAADLDAVIIPVGGGGLMGGTASAIRQMRPGVRIIAVELAEGPGLGPARAAGHPVPVPRPANTLADGMTPPFVGALPLSIAESCVDELVTVTEPAIHEAMAMLLTRAKLYVEGSGAAALGALRSGAVRLPRGSRAVAIVSGGNVDPEKALAAMVQAVGIEA
ncbi:MAG TPA: threonine/serine dehydratase [Candidatus Udaeobacter sp.]|jgi:threonine dehydratase|nr:threonine/serine dehydratase [Candidatus Udaeobacter sp.]